MAEKKSQTLVRVEPEDLTKWKEAATIRGQSLNQWLNEAGNRALSVNGLDAFATTSVVRADVQQASGVDPLVAFDLALDQTPTLTGQRKWVDPQALREELAKLLTRELTKLAK